MPRFYLDQAATSWPKNPQVLDAVDSFLRDCGAASGRGSYGSALVSTNWVDRARMAIAQLIGATSPSDIALLNSGTQALNEAIMGAIEPGCHVITTAIEHNSLLRPLERLRQEGFIELEIVPCDPLGWVNPEDVFKLRRSNTKLFAISHASNVTGMIQAIEDFGHWCNANEIIYLVDAAQSIGYVPIDVGRSGIDYLAAPGHKGLGGILGTGILYLTQARQAAHRPLMCGGSGSRSESLSPELDWPHKVEPGNANIPGIVSLAVATEKLLQKPIETSMAEMQADWVRMKNQLAQVPSLHMHASNTPQRHVSVLSCTHERLSPADMAAILDAELGVEVRAGWHCAASIHRYLGTTEGGTLRFSFGHSLSLPIVKVLENVVEILSQC